VDVAEEPLRSEELRALRVIALHWINGGQHEFVTVTGLVEYGLDRDEAVRALDCLERRGWLVRGHDQGLGPDDPGVLTAEGLARARALEARPGAGPESAGRQVVARERPEVEPG